MAGLGALFLFPGFSWWVALLWIFTRRLSKKSGEARSVDLLPIGWTALSVLTPFYHPYARLWLPIEAMGWLLTAGLFARVPSQVEYAGGDARWPSNKMSAGVTWLALCSVGFAAISFVFHSTRPRMSLLGPSDSLRRAAGSMMSALPKEITELRVYARPPLLFYLNLAGGIAVRRQPDVAHLLDLETPGSWGVLDLALVRQEYPAKTEMDRLRAGWVLVREIPTTLNAPTLLDIDPATAYRDVIDASAPVQLLHSLRMETVR
jgi:hypothetical protein